MRSLVRAVVLAALAPAAPALADFDGDGVPDLSDNCLIAANPAQDDADEDGIGDVCQCGDVSDDGLVDALDLEALRQQRAGLLPAVAAPQKCPVIPAGCDLANLVVLERALQGAFPPLEQACATTGTVSVDAFGAVGDGLAYDHDAIQAAADAAGVGGLVHFSPGKTYVLCKRLVPTTGQLWWGRGAVLRRCDSVQSVLTSPALAGATEVEVADATGFLAGMRITPVKGPGVHDGEGSSLLHTVAATTATTIEFNNPLIQNYAVGDLVISFNELVLYDPTSLRITMLGFTFDGNRAGNDDYIAWQHPASIKFSGFRQVLRDNRFVDTWSNGLHVFRLTDGLIERNEFRNGGAAAAHLTRSVDVEFRDNVMVDLNELAELAEHSEGAITWSAQNRGIRVIGNCVANLPVAAFGEVRFHSNSDILIEDNQVCDTQGFWEGLLNRAPVGGYSPTGGVEIRGNLAINTGRSLQAGGGYIGARVQDFVVANNVFRNGYLDLEMLDQLTVSGNLFWMEDPLTYGPAGSYGDRSGLLSLRRCADAGVIENDLVGGDKGIFVTNEDGFVSQGVSVDANQLLDQTNDALQVGALDEVAIDGWQGEYAGVEIWENVLSSLVVDPDEDIASLGRHVLFAENCVESSERGVRVYGNPASTGVPDSFYEDNVVAVGSEPLSYELAGQLNDLQITGNTLSEPLPAAFAAGSGNLIEANTIDSGASCAVAAPATPPTACSCSAP